MRVDEFGKIREKWIFGFVFQDGGNKTAQGVFVRFVRRNPARMGFRFSGRFQNEFLQAIAQLAGVYRRRAGHPTGQMPSMDW